MNKFTKFLGMALLAVLTLSMTSCGGDSNDDLDDNGKSAVEESDPAEYSISMTYSGDTKAFEAHTMFSVCSDDKSSCYLDHNSDYSGEWVSSISGSAGNTYYQNYGSSGTGDLTVTSGPKAGVIATTLSVSPVLGKSGTITVKVSMKKNGQTYFTKEYSISSSQILTVVISTSHTDKEGNYDISNIQQI